MRMYSWLHEFCVIVTCHLVGKWSTDGFSFNYVYSPAALAIPPTYSSASQRFDPGQMYVNDLAEIFKAKRAPYCHTLSAKVPLDFDRHAAAF